MASPDADIPKFPQPVVVQAVLTSNHSNNGNCQVVATRLIDSNGNKADNLCQLPPKTWFSGLYTCFQPILDKIQWAKTHEDPDGNWEIPFDELHDFQYLASGAQGLVYKARFRGRDVAVKKVNELKDAECMRKLSRHPNIVQLYGVCLSPCCVVMEYCTIGSLADWLRKQRPRRMKLPRVVDWARQIACGMALLHSKKILHRDLKSANVLIADGNAIKITDFGTSRDWSSVDSNDSVFMTFAGTIPWMAPEMIRSEKCSDKVDVWSYGVVLWELLTCDVPYREIPLPAVLYGVGNGSLSLAIPQDCPSGLELLLRLCWTSKPRNRPSFNQIMMHLDIAEREIQTSPLTANKTRVRPVDVVDANANPQEYETALISEYEQRLKDTTELFDKLKTFLRQLERSQKYLDSGFSVSSSRRYSF